METTFYNQTFTGVELRRFPILCLFFKYYTYVFMYIYIYIYIYIYTYIYIYIWRELSYLKVRSVPLLGSVMHHKSCSLRNF